MLADGMGGHTGGAIAGQTACKTFTEVFSTATAPLEARLKTALHASNEALAKGVEQNAALKGMGCTIVAAWIDDLGIRWTSVGDLLLLLYRLPDVIRLNADHSLGSFLDEQARQNKITRSEARRNRNRNALRSALTGSKIDLIDLRSEPLELRPGDWVVLASDGICSLPGDEIADVIYRFRQSTPEEMADGLIAAVTQKGVVDQDNTTVVAVRIDAAADDVSTRGWCARPKGEEVDLRTRRIGVSRRGPAAPPQRRGEDTRGRRVAGCRGCARVLRRCAHARRAVAPADHALQSGGALCRPTAPANAAVDRPAGPVAPAKPPARHRQAAVEPPPRSRLRPEPRRAGRAGESQEGAAPRASQSKSAATPPRDLSPGVVQRRVPRKAPRPRSAPSKPAASQPAPPAASSPSARQPREEAIAAEAGQAAHRHSQASVPSAAAPSPQVGDNRGRRGPPRRTKEVERSRPKSSSAYFGEEQGRRPSRSCRVREGPVQRRPDHAMIPPAASVTVRAVVHTLGTFREQSGTGP